MPVLFTPIRQGSQARWNEWAARRLIWLCGLSLLILAPQAGSEEVYRWIDDQGRIHLVDQINRVPDAYRDTLKVYEVSSDVKKAHPPRKGEHAEPVSGVSQDTGGSPGTPAARSTEIDDANLGALRERMRQVTEEKRRLKALETRFRTKTSRATVYRKRIEELDEEATAIHGEIKKIRGSDQ